jgi:hypothetical protein
VLFSAQNEEDQQAPPRQIVLFLAADREPNEFKLKAPLGISQPPTLVSGASEQLQKVLHFLSSSSPCLLGTVIFKLLHLPILIAEQN